MYSFKQYLNESKNTHLEHLEDEILNFGIGGARGAINFLQELRNMLSGQSSGGVNMTVKWDGAPAIVCGNDPVNGKFFVGTKSVFNARTPKINYSFQEFFLCFLQQLLCDLVQLFQKELYHLHIS